MSKRQHQKFLIKKI